VIFKPASSAIRTVLNPNPQRVKDLFFNNFCLDKAVTDLVKLRSRKCAPSLVGAFLFLGARVRGFSLFSATYFPRPLCFPCPILFFLAGSVEILRSAQDDRRYPLPNQGGTR